MRTTSLHRPAPAGPDGARTAMVLALTGDVGIAMADRLRRYLDGVIDRGCDVVVDCARTRLVDGVCVEVLAEAARAAGPGQRVVLAAPSPLVRAALEVTGADSDLRTYADRDAALLACDSPSPAVR
ncbi:STAS domain-containing protein [Actinoplanes sp. N902-109]|uniref:STAS domain-containing protein n=1 Tax=Actinoplanes sp. (strain N902-109) TaxID=649831 RepID=UPI00032937A4|nr:STAS domain-containing protein [Actinoplanes sp. N902-109]AGL16287.1 hypothetical protein L083_2777 [Actinoplanes sp. N902-109]